MITAEKIFSNSLVKLVWYKLRLILSSNKSQIPANMRGLRSIIWGCGSLDGYERVPRTIWSYWGGTNSECAEACRKTWDSFKSNFVIHVLTADTIKNFIPDFPNLPSNVPEQKISNLIRLILLERYGGIWVDYSTVLTRSLDWVADLLEVNDCEMMAFYNEFPDEYKANLEHPIIENGFLAAKADSKFISDWRKVYQECILSSDYKNFFRTHKNFYALTSNFVIDDVDHINYFVCYLAAQQVMLNSNFYRLLLINAEDEYYYYSYSLNPPRNKRKFAEELLIRSFTGNASSKLIKITGRHREALDEHIKYGCYRRDSIIGIHLNH